MMSHPNWYLAALLSDFGPERKLVRTVADCEILLLRREHGIVAASNRCTHLNKPLTDARVFAGQLICPFHGACYDLRSGEAVSGPAVYPLTLYDTRIDGDEIWVNMTPR